MHVEDGGQAVGHVRELLGGDGGRRRGVVEPVAVRSGEGDSEQSGVTHRGERLGWESVVDLVAVRDRVRERPQLLVDDDADVVPKPLDLFGRGRVVEQAVGEPGRRGVDRVGGHRVSLGSVASLTARLRRSEPLKLGERDGTRIW